MRRRAGAWLALSLAIIVFLVATDTPLLRLAYAVIPGFSTFRPLGRLLYLYNFALALLAGLGLDISLRWLAKRAAAEKQRAASNRLRFSTLAIATVAIGLSARQLIRYGRKLNPPFPPRSDALLYR